MEEKEGPLPGTSPSDTHKSGLDILVVDDDRLVLNVVSEIVSAVGHHPHTATDGDAALEAMSAHHYDLVISDIRMPGMDGFQLAARVRVEYPDTYLVLMTGFSSDSTFREAMKLDVDAYLSKPFKSVELIRVLDKIVEENSLAE